jgi:hypothetical protein
VLLPVTDNSTGHTAVTHDRVRREIALITVHGMVHFDHSTCSACLDVSSNHLLFPSNQVRDESTGSVVYTCMIISFDVAWLDGL